MENATKALLIAAAVLITIVLVAAGVLLIRNIADTDKQAQEVGNLISGATDNASNAVIGGAKGIIISKSKFNSFINDFKEKYSTSNQLLDTILNEQNGKLSNQIQVIGYVYQDNGNKLKNDETEELKELLKNFDKSNQENNKEYFDYIINVWIPKLLQDGKIKPLNDPLDEEERIAGYKEVYKNKKRSRTYR